MWLLTLSGCCHALPAVEHWKNCSFQRRGLWMKLIHTNKTYSSCRWFSNSCAFCTIMATVSFKGKLQPVLKIELFQHCAEILPSRVPHKSVIQLLQFRRHDGCVICSYNLTTVDPVNVWLQPCFLGATQCDSSRVLCCCVNQCSLCGHEKIRRVLKSVKLHLSSTCRHTHAAVSPKSKKWKALDKQTEPLTSFKLIVFG